jgi:dihydroflavonol-4-reductase
MARAFAGADVVFHCAAVVEIAPRVTKALHEGNVVGTANVMEAVRKAGVKRLVHCSSTAATGVSDGTRDVTEDDPWNLPEHGLADGYASTKHESQEMVVAAAREGLDAVVVQPTYMFGPYDVRPSSGAIVVELSRGGVPVSAPGSQNIVDVRDVARGMILAWEKGRRGEKYILGGQNVTYGQMFERIGQILGVRAPRWVPPYFIAFLIGAIAELASALLGRSSQLSRSTVRYAYTPGYRHSSEKAKRDLGYAPGDPDEGIRACVAWLREHGKIAARKD